MASPLLRTKDKNSTKSVQRINPLALVKEPTNDTAKSIRCKNCAQVVTKPDLAINPEGKTYRNPQGVDYHIVCYKDAPGASDMGVPTTEFSWFLQHAWSFAHCIKCRSHLGWWFAGPTRFIGLITAKVVLSG